MDRGRKIIDERVVDGFRQVLEFIGRGIGMEADRRRLFELRLLQLTAPHMPRLVRRRTKLLVGTGQQRWSDELDSFMRQDLWPMLGAELQYAQNNHIFVTLMLDIAIEREQWRTTPESPASVPRIAQLDANWAS